MLSETADLKGCWSNPVGANVGLRHDPSLFRDDDGTWWMIWGNTAIAPLKPDWSGYARSPIPVHPSDAVALGHEGSTLLKIENRYVLFGTGWSTSQWRKGSYNLYYTTSDRITGPYGSAGWSGDSWDMARPSGTSRGAGGAPPFQTRTARRCRSTASSNATFAPTP